MRSPAPVAVATLLVASLGTLAAEAQQATVLRLTPEVGLVSRYRMSMEMFMDGPGLPFPAGTAFMQQEMITTQTVTGVEGTARQMTMVIDSLTLSSPAMPGMIPQPEGITGMTQEMVMDDRGRIVSMEIGDGQPDPQVRELIEGINQGMSGLGFEFPDGPVTVGESWTANQEMTLPGGPGQGITLTTESTYTLLRIERVGTARQAVLGVLSIMRGAPGGVVAGMEGEANGEVVVDLTAGRMVSTNAKMTFNIAGPTGEMMTMTSRFDMTLVN